MNWARQTIAGLIAGGVRSAVVCPGSRSAPLALAAAESNLPLFVIIDERSAAFFALGQARATGLPTAVICTSGTAGAHFYPAVIEASHSSVPLVVVTADRPPELHGTGASQTIDQRALFGSFVREAIDLGCASDELAEMRGLADKLSRACAAALGPNPGPVHINAPARKPLLEDKSVSTLEVIQREAPLLLADAAALEAARARLAHAERALVVAGPIAATDHQASAACADLARALGAPLFAEATSQLLLGDIDANQVRDFDGLLRRHGFEPDAPDAIIEIGHPPTSAGYARTIAANPSIWRLALRPFVAADPQRSADVILAGDLATSIRALLPTEARPSDFAAKWIARGRGFGSGAAFCGQAAVACITERLPPGSELVVGNSLPIRWLDQVSVGRPARVHCQRGVAGIDGLIAGAAGVAFATKQPTTLVLGDVSAAHDVGSLAVAAELESPLAICVLDNGGGQIFAELPYAKKLAPADLEALFAAPPRVDIARAAASFGVEAVRAQNRAELEGALEAAYSTRGTTLIHCVVDATSPPVLS